MILFDLVKKLLGVKNVDEITDEMVTDYYNKTYNSDQLVDVEQPTEDVVVTTEITDDGTKEIKATDITTGEQVKVETPLKPALNEGEKPAENTVVKTTEEVKPAEKVVNAGCEKPTEKKVVNANCEAQLTEEDLKKAALNKSVAITKDYVDGLHGDDFFKFLHSNKELVKEMYK